MTPDLSRSDLRGLNLTTGQLDELLDGYRELETTYLEGSQRIGQSASLRPRTLGIGIAKTTRAGRVAAEAALLVLVDRLADSKRGLQLFTDRGIPVVYEEVGEIQIQAGFRGQHRPVLCGTSIAPCGEAYTGTLGCVVESGTTRYMLSNNHVLANNNALALGTTISQRSTEDGGKCPADVIGTLSHYVPIVHGGSTSVDAALATFSAGVAVDPRIIRNGSAERLVSPVQTPVLGLTVQKSGRTTGHTRAANVKAIGLTVRVRCGTLGSSTFSNVFSIRTANGSFSEGGDSGSLVTTDPDNQPVGLLFAGDTMAKTSYAHRLADVLTALSGLTGASMNVVY